jgi:hypothetical protein
MSTSERLQERILGTEVECGLVCWDSEGNVLNNHSIYDELAASLPDGVYVHEEFMSNGARFYGDCGDHLEITTPECSSIDEAVTYELAGEQIVLQGLQRLRENGTLGSFRLHKRVFDEKGHFWGSHESYLTDRGLSPESGNLGIALAAHLATRNIFAGAGRVSRRGFNVAQKTRGLDVLHYPAAHVDGSRPLVETRDEPLADMSRYRRVHVSSGDANILYESLRLKLGTTALIFRLAECGVDLRDMELENPLKTAKIVADDSRLEESFRFSDGERATAIDVQYELAMRARELSEREELPAEELAIIEDWLTTCDLLETNPDALVGKIDWITKRRRIEKLFPSYSDDNLAKRRAYDMEYDLLGEGKGYEVRQKLLSIRQKKAIERAMTIPPAGTRAAIRGQVVIDAALNGHGNYPPNSVYWDKVRVNPGSQDIRRLKLLYWVCRSAFLLASSGDGVDKLDREKERRLLAWFGRYTLQRVQGTKI